MDGGIRAFQVWRRSCCILALGAGLAWGQGLPGETEEARIQREFEAFQNVKVKIASRVEQGLREAPAVVSILRKEEIRLRGWQRLSEALEQIPGFATRWQAGGDQGLVVRGMFAQDGVLVMLDGIALNDPLNGNIAFHDLPLEGVERIEVARGPGSALYGGFAFLAVINIITAPAPALLRESRVEAGGGDRRSSLGHGSFESPLGPIQLKIHGGVHRIRDRRVTVPDDLLTSLMRRTTVGDRAYDRYGVIARDSNERYLQSRQWQVGGHLSVSEGPFAGLFLDGMYIQKISEPVLSRLYALVDQGLLERRDDLSLLGLSWPFHLSGAIRLTPRIYGTSIYSRSAGQITRPYGWDDDEDFDGITERWPAGRVEARAYRFHTLGSEVVADLALLESHTLSAGLVFERTWLDRTQYHTNASRLSSGIEVSFNNNQVVDAQAFDPKQNRQDSWLLTGRDGPRIRQDIDRRLWSAFVQDIWNLRPGLAATLGLRFDRFTRFGSALSPRAVLVWNINGKAYLKGLYGKAFKPPTFLALHDGTVTLKNERQVYGNPSLGISTLHTEELIFGYQASPAVLFQANLFSTRTHGEVVFNGNLEEYRNEASRDSRGAELEVRASWPTLQSHFSYAFSRAERGEGTGAPLYPRQQINLGASYRNLFSRIDLGGTLVWRSAFRREARDARKPLSASTLLQAQVGIRLSRRLLLNLRGTNLLDQDWRSPVDRSLGDVLPGDIPREGRYLEARMIVKF